MKKGGGGLKAKTIFLWGRGGGGEMGVGCEAVIFFNPVGSFVKMYNFLQVMVLLKMQFVQMGSVGMKKKFLFSEEGSPEKKKSYASAMVVVLTDKLTL